jgi:hypothetical protein
MMAQRLIPITLPPKSRFMPTLARQYLLEIPGKFPASRLKRGLPYSFEDSTTPDDGATPHNCVWT